MHVGPAVRLFSHQTAAGLRIAVHLKILPQDALSTAWFIEQVCLWFEMTSARSRKVTITRRNMTKKLSFIWKFLQMFRGIQIGEKDIWKPLNYGMTIANLTICDICYELLKEGGYDFLLTHRLNQDAVENIFSQIRKKAGSVPKVSQCLTAIKGITVSQFVSEVKRSNYHNGSDLMLLDYFAKKKKNQSVESVAGELKLQKSTYPVPDKSCFPTVQLNDEDCIKNRFDLNMLYYVTGCALNALLNDKKKLCEPCKQFFEIKLDLGRDFVFYNKSRDKGGLKFPNIQIYTLIVNCEIIYKKYAMYILHTNNLKFLIDKIANDVNVVFPKCKTCMEAKKFIVNHFFKIRCYSTENLAVAKKRKGTFYGTANPKRKKI